MENYLLTACCLSYVWMFIFFSSLSKRDEREAMIFRYAKTTLPKYHVIGNYGQHGSAVSMHPLQL